MNRKSLALFLISAAGLCATAPIALCQELFRLPDGPREIKKPDASPKRGYYTVVPLKEGATKVEDIINQSTTGTTIPLWGYGVVSPLDNKSYSGQMVGRAPFFHGHRSTSVQAYLVPVALTFDDTNTVFDPTAPDACIGNDTVMNVTVSSPMFQNASFTMNQANVGTTQYVDAFQRANFWGYVAGTSYHTLLTLKTLPKISVSVGTTAGFTSVSNFCGYYGELDYNVWDSYVQNTLIPSLKAQGVGPTDLPIFIFDSVVMYGNSDPNDCCILGYHGSYTPSNVLQTYSVTNFDTAGDFSPDISTISHEIAEWMNDPLGTNATPAWGHIGQVTGCQNNLEVGDPLSGTFFPSVTMNGFTYNPQELAFFTWFYRLSPSFGAGGLYSNNGTLTSGQGACS